MKTFIRFLLCFVSLSALAQGPVLRGPLTTNTPTASTSVVQNVIAPAGAMIRHTAPSRSISDLAGRDVTQCILTNSGYPEVFIYEASLMQRNDGQVEVIYGVWTNGFGNPNRGYVAAAVGPSLESLVKIGEVLGPTGSEAYLSPGRLYREGNTNYLTYFAGNSGAGFEIMPSSIGIAWTTNGTNWSKHGSYLLSVGTAGQWDDGTLYVGNIVKNGLTYFLYYNAFRNLDSVEYIGFATATNILGPYTKYSGNPVITNATWTGFAADPNIFPANEGGWGMLYRGLSAAAAISRPAAAWSPDLTNWYGKANVTLRSFHPLVNPDNGVSGTHLYGGGIFEDNGLALLADDLTHIYVLRPSVNTNVTVTAASFVGDGSQLTGISGGITTTNTPSIGQIPEATSATTYRATANVGQQYPRGQNYYAFLGDSITTGWPLNITNSPYWWPANYYTNSALSGLGLFESLTNFTFYTSNSLPVGGIGTNVIIHVSGVGNDIIRGSNAWDYILYYSNVVRNFRVNKGWIVVGSTIQPRETLPASTIEPFNEWLRTTTNGPNHVVDFARLASDPWDKKQYFDSVHPSTNLYYRMWQTWDQTVRLGLTPTPPTITDIYPISNTNATLRVYGQNGGGGTNMMEWIISYATPGTRPAPESYVNSLGAFSMRGATLLRTDTAFLNAEGGAFGGISSKGNYGAGVFVDTVTARIVFKTGNTDLWRIANTGNFLAETDNAWGIGLDGASRPSHLYVAGIAKWGSNYVSGVSTITNGTIIRSNSIIAQPTLVNGDTWYMSSNGQPHVVWIDFSGVRHTNDLTATGSGATSPIEDTGGTDRFIFTDNLPTQVADEEGFLVIEANAAADVLELRGAGAANNTALLISENVIATDDGTTVLHGNGGGLSNVQTSALVGDLAVQNGYITNLYVGTSEIKTNSGAITVFTNIFVLGTRYTNANQRAWISQSFVLASSATGSPGVLLEVEQDGKTNRQYIALGSLASLISTNHLDMMIGPAAKYTFSDVTSGTGASANVVTNTASWIGL